MNIGLFLGAGGSVGVAYHGGVLAGLQEMTGWDPRQASVVVGTSAGSVTAAVLRAGVPAADLAAISEGRPLSPEGARLAAIGRPSRPRPTPAHMAAFRPVTDPAAIVSGLRRPWTSSLRALAIAAAPAGGIPTDAISSGIDAVYSGRWPDAPLWICAWDVRAGRRVVFGKEGEPRATVGSAVAASAAIPSYFRPVEIGGRRYVDGGVHSMVNLDLAADAGLDLVVVAAPMAAAAPWPGLRPDDLLRQRLRARLLSQAARMRRAGLPVVVVAPGRSVVDAMGPNPMDAARRLAVSVAAREGVRRWLSRSDEGRRLAGILSQEAGRRPAAAARTV